jgi:hypothetical protein
MAGLRPLLCVVGAGTVAPLAACSYDWAVDQGAPGVDAATDVMTQPDVAAVDASEAGGHDATVIVDSGAPPKDTGAPPSEAGPDCPALTQQLLAARNQAIQCTETASACMTTLPDECGCQVVVGGDPSAESAFTTAVNAFTHPGCSTTTPVMLCPGTCPTVGHVCLAMEGGAFYTCYQ